MKRIITIALALAGATAAASAQDIGGIYLVEGTNLDGSAYEGTAEIMLTSETTCEIVWDTGSVSNGICSRNGNAFAAAYVLEDVVGLVIYQVQSDGTLDGLWTIAGQEGVGTETLTPE